VVTGGAGFIGSHTVDAPVGRGGRVRVLDTFGAGHIENLAEALAAHRRGGTAMRWSVSRRWWWGRWQVTLAVWHPPGLQYVRDAAALARRVVTA